MRPKFHGHDDFDGRTWTFLLWLQDLLSQGISASGDKCHDGGLDSPA